MRRRWTDRRAVLAASLAMAACFSGGCAGGERGAVPEREPERLDLREATAGSVPD